MSTIIETSTHYQYYVNDAQKAACMERLQQRIAKGEDPYDILQISREQSYFVNKFLQGLFPICGEMYKRIMGNYPIRRTEDFETSE